MAKNNQKLLETIVNLAYVSKKDTPEKFVTTKQIAKELNVPETTVTYYLHRAKVTNLTVDGVTVTDELANERRRYMYENFNGRLKLTPEKTESICRRILIEKEGVMKVAEDEFMTPSCISRALKRGAEINLDLGGLVLTEEFLSDWRPKFGDRIVELKNRRYGKGIHKKYGRLGSVAQRKKYLQAVLIVSKGPESTTPEKYRAALEYVQAKKDNSVKGGNATQKRHGERVEKNLDKNSRYGHYYNFKFRGIVFDSKGEAFLGQLLNEFNIIKEIIPGETYHRQMGGIIVDFYDGKNVIEYHPIANKHPMIEEKTIDDYMKRRYDELMVEDVKGDFVGNLYATESYTATDMIALISQLRKRVTAERFIEVFDRVRKSLKSGRYVKLGANPLQEEMGF